MSIVTRYLIILTIVSIPFWISGYLFQFQILPGLPFGAIAFTAPALSLFLMGIGKKYQASRSVWQKLTSLKGSRFGMIVLSIAIMPLCIFGGVLIRDTHVSLQEWNLNLLRITLLIPAFVIAAYCEEVGWTGILGNELRNRHGVLFSGLVVGTVWAFWHLIPYIQTGHDLTWITGQSLYTILLRVLIFQFAFAQNGSLGLASLVHGFSNVGWQSIPNPEIQYDPWATSMVVGIVCSVCILYGNFVKKCRPDT